MVAGGCFFAGTCFMVLGGNGFFISEFTTSSSSSSITAVSISRSGATGGVGVLRRNGTSTHRVLVCRLDPLDDVDEHDCLETLPEFEEQAAVEVLGSAARLDELDCLETFLAFEEQAGVELVGSGVEARLGIKPNARFIQ